MCTIRNLRFVKYCAPGGRYERDIENRGDRIRNGDFRRVLLAALYRGAEIQKCSAREEAEDWWRMKWWCTNTNAILDIACILYHREKRERELARVTFCFHTDYASSLSSTVTDPFVHACVRTCVRGAFLYVCMYVNDSINSLTGRLPRAELPLIERKCVDVIPLFR